MSTPRVDVDVECRVCKWSASWKGIEDMELVVEWHERHLDEAHPEPVPLDQAALEANIFR